MYLEQIGVRYHPSDDILFFEIIQVLDLEQGQQLLDSTNTFFREAPDIPEFRNVIAYCHLEGVLSRTGTLEPDLVAVGLVFQLSLKMLELFERYDRIRASRLAAAASLPVVILNNERSRSNALGAFRQNFSVGTPA